MAYDPFAESDKSREDRGKTVRKARSQETTPVSFRLDRNLVNRFKAHCAVRGESMTRAIERLMLDDLG